MATATQQQQQQQQQQQLAATATVTAKEEALKRNTDCVYFLASPLTCKKGIECEYRHSEYARVNPRDCYFWLNGNCLNQKCGFRHPPLDGLIGESQAAAVGSSLPVFHTARPSATQIPYTSRKQAAPCIFFQKGLCLKGDRCAFLHGASNISNLAPQVTAATPNSEAPSQKIAFGGLKKCTQEQMTPSKVVEAPVEAKPSSITGIVTPRSDMRAEKNELPPKPMDDEVSRHKATNDLVNRNSGRSNSLHLSQVANDQNFQNNKDYDEFLKESSPGFDVLVDDDLRDSDYYQGEDQYGKKRYHEERNLNAMDEFELGRATDYRSITDIDREMHCDSQGYDPYEHIKGQHAWEHHRASSERMAMGPAYLEGRGYSKSNSPERISESDLRYHLSKRRRVNGLRSVVSHDSIHDDHTERKGSWGSSGRDSHHLPSHNRSIRSRLHGRIKLPGKPSSSGSDLRTEQEMDGARNWGRLSPGRPQISYQGRLHDRIKSSVEEDCNNEGRDIRRPHLRREITDEACTDFAGPKSLTELKVARDGEGRIQQSFGKQKHVESHLLSEGDLSFEGPMPLSEILKRKREAEAAASGSGMPYVNKDHYNQKGSEESFVSNLNNAALAEIQYVFPSGSKDMLKKKEESTPATAAAVKAAAEDIELSHEQSQKPNLNELETEDVIIVEDGTEEHEFEGEDQGDGDYEYEQGDEGDYAYEEGENVDAEEGENVDVEEEYGDGEDGDDFAKKIGVMFS